MTNTASYQGDDLAAIVWPRQSEPLVRAGHMTWEEAAREAWAMEMAKADRVRILVAVFDDEVVGAWSVAGVSHETVVPEGKTRRVNRSSFETVDDPRLSYLVGGPSPRPRQRNPQATLELRDLPGADVLIGTADRPSHGLVRLGDFTLTVAEDGRAELHMPRGAALTVRTAA
jgi:hypothetical protein